MPSISVWWSGGPVLDAKDQITEMSSYLRVQVRHDPAPEEEGSPSIETSVAIHFVNNEPDPLAQVSSLTLGSSGSSFPRPEKDVRLEFSTSSPCPTPKSLPLDKQSN